MVQNLRVITCNVVTDSFCGTWPFDHYPVIADLSY